MAYPVSPTNGQIYGNKRYNSTVQGWEELLDSTIQVSGNKVLINNTDINAKLGVKGDISYNSAIFSTPQNGYGPYIGNYNSSGIYYSFAIGHGITGDNGQEEIRDFTVTANGNVLIGTIVDKSRLTVSNVSGATMFLAKSSGAGSIAFGSEAMEYGLIESVSGGGLDFYTGNNALSKKMTIASGGNVSIGTGFAGLRLNVSGVESKTSTAADSLAFFGSNNTVSPWGLEIYQAGAPAIANRYVSVRTIEQGVAAGGNLVIQNGSGNILVGTITNNTNNDKLQVSGDVNIYNGNLRLGALTSTYLYLGNKQINTNDSTALELQGPGGNVLIGTTVDGVGKLQVSGSANISEEIIHNGIRTRTYTWNDYGGSGILPSCFGNVPTAGELYVTEIGTGKYLNATFFKQEPSLAAIVTVLASSGLSIGNSNNQGTQVIDGATNNNNIRMVSIIRALY